ncbi:GxxExxY protein [bacterium]|nr:GxxExxY protein [bacterium]
MEPQRRGARRATAEENNQLTEQVIGAAIAVHRELGPGLLESVYESCLAFELRERGCIVERQRPQPVKYKTLTIEVGYRIDLAVRSTKGTDVLVELKAVDKVIPIHGAQLLTHLRLSDCAVGLLINFNVELLKDGVTRFVNDFPEALCASSAHSAPPR